MNKNIKENLIAACIGIPILLSVYFFSTVIIPIIDSKNMKQYEEYVAREPSIIRIDENTFRITFNSFQNDCSIKWLDKNKYKINYCSYGGKNGDIPVYFVTMKKD